MPDHSGTGRRRIARAGSLKHAWASDHSLTALLIVLVGFLFVVYPMGADGVFGRLVIGTLFSLLLVSGMGVVSRSWLVTTAVGIAVLTVMALRWREVFSGNVEFFLWEPAVMALLSGLLAAVVLVQTMREGPITMRRIQGGVAAYLLIGVAFAFAYAWIVLRWPDALTMSDSMREAQDNDLMSHLIYFSFVTLTTVGFGDVTAVHPMARSLVMLEALIGQLYPAILLARLVSLELQQRGRE